MKKKKIRVMTYGTFDVLHRGHIRLLTRARALGDELLVGLSTDAFNRIKGKRSVFPYRERKLLVESLRFVDRVIPENNWNQKSSDIKRYNVDILVMGDDWLGKFDFLRQHCDVIYLPRTLGISTTQIKQRMAAVKKL